jgi:hypothetical protein
MVLDNQNRYSPSIKIEGEVGTYTSIFLVDFPCICKQNDYEKSSPINEETRSYMYCLPVSQVRLATDEC